MAKINILENNYPMDYREAFENLASHMFCVMLNLREGVNRPVNKKGIESDPVRVGSKVYAFQAKYYDAGTRLADKKNELIASVREARRLGVTDLVIFVNKDHSENGRTGEKALYFKEIELAAQGTENEPAVNLDWWELSKIEQTLDQPEYRYIRDLYLRTEGTDHLSVSSFYEYIMSACMIIQKRMIFWSKPGHDVPEDARNDEMRDLLISQGLTVHDQTHTGYGATGKNPGEVDLMIIKPQGDLQKEMTLVEAMNLSGVRKKYIFTHLEKLVKGYNTSGLRDLYLVSYVELERSKYSSFWKRYKNVVLTLNGEEFIVDNEVAPVINEELGWIKSIKLAYDYKGQRFFVYHICVRVAE